MQQGSHQLLALRRSSDVRETLSEVGKEEEEVSLPFPFPSTPSPGKRGRIEGGREKFGGRGRGKKSEKLTARVTLTQPLSSPARDRKGRAIYNSGAPGVYGGEKGKEEEE